MAASGSFVFVHRVMCVILCVACFWHRVLSCVSAGACIIVPVRMCAYFFMIAGSLLCRTDAPIAACGDVELDEGHVMPLRLRGGLLADDKLDHMWLLIRMLRDALKPWYVNGSAGAHAMPMP